MLFSRFDAASQRVQDRMFGELFRHLPRMRAENVNAGIISDPSRPVQVVTAIYTDRDSDPALANIPEAGANRRPGYSARVLKIEVSEQTAQVRVGDLFERLADEQIYQVTATSTDDMRRNHLTVTKVEA